MSNKTFIFTYQHENGLWVHVSSYVLKHALPPIIITEAMSIINGIFHMNAKGAIGYAFNFEMGNSARGITDGEFVYKLRDIIEHYDFVYIFKEGVFCSPMWSSYENSLNSLNPSDARKYGVSNK